MSESLSGPRLTRPGDPTRRPGAATPGELTSDLVKQVADKVYAMLMADIAIERERQRPSSRVIGRTGDW
jgi:hypothetical protein